MVAYNFKKQFADDVESGKKGQTIRKAGKRRPPKVGEELQLYTGMRTTACRLLRKAKCTDVIPVLFTRRRGTPILCIAVGFGDRASWAEVVASEVTKIATKDGFKSSVEFFAYFLGEGEEEFRGYLIEWGPV